MTSVEIIKVIIDQVQVLLESGQTQAVIEVLPELRDLADGLNLAVCDDPVEERRQIAILYELRLRRLLDYLPPVPFGCGPSTN